MNVATTLSSELSQYVESCLILQAFFLNILWIILFWAWSISWKNHPKLTLAGGTPSKFHTSLAVAAWAVVFGISLYEFEPVYWFLGFAIANGVLLSVLNPAFSMCFSMAMLFMRPWEIMSSNQLILALPRFSIFFSLGWAFFYFVVADRFSFRVHKVLLVLVAYCVWVFLSTFVTPNPGLALGIFNETVIRAFTLFYLVYHLARDRFSVWSLKVTLITIFSCVGLISIVFFFQGYREDNRIIAFGIFKNANDIAAVMTILLPLAFAPFLRAKKSTLAMVLSVPCILIAVLVIGLAQSRGAIMSLAMSGVFYAFLKIRRKKIAIAAVLTILVLGQLSVLAFKRQEGDLEGSSTSRKSFWISGLRMALYHPVFGVGIGQFPENFENYATDITGEFGKRTAHSTWILALAEGGPVGFLLLTTFFIYGGGVLAFRQRKDEPEWLYSTVAYGTAITFLSHTYVLFPYVLIALITAGDSARSAAARKPFRELT